jgi:pimeloyl-ACP methyl ester carboxylesterase
VVYFHGTASSRLEALLLKKLVEDAGLQIISIDRPGYGLSSFKHRKSLQDFNVDVNYVTSHLGIKQFAVLGWSGGGAFALAYLSYFPEKVTNAVIVSAPSLPFDAATAHDMPFARYLMKFPLIGRIAMKGLRRQLLRANGDLQVFLRTPQGRQLLHGCSPRDLEFFSDPEWMPLMYQSMVEAFRQDVDSTVEEHQLFLKSWNLPFSRVPPGKLRIWHGEQDKTCRVSNAYAIALVVSADLEVFSGMGHCVMFDNLNELGRLLGSE